jgi:hypothetical protein
MRQRLVLQQTIAGVALMLVITVAGVRVGRSQSEGWREVGRCTAFNRAVVIYEAPVHQTVVVHLNNRCGKPLELVVSDQAGKELAKGFVSRHAWERLTVRVPQGGRITIDNGQNPFPADDNSPVSVRFEVQR